MGLLIGKKLHSKLSNKESFTFVHSSEMKESSALSYKIKHKEINFDPLVYITYVKEMSNFTHTHK